MWVFVLWVLVLATARADESRAKASGRTRAPATRDLPVYSPSLLALHERLTQKHRTQTGLGLGVGVKLEHAATSSRTLSAREEAAVHASDSEAMTSGVSRSSVSVGVGVGAAAASTATANAALNLEDKYPLKWMAKEAALVFGGPRIGGAKPPKGLPTTFHNTYVDPKIAVKATQDWLKGDHWKAKGKILRSGDKIYLMDNMRGTISTQEVEPFPDATDVPDWVFGRMRNHM